MITHGSFQPLRFCLLFGFIVAILSFFYILYLYIMKYLYINLFLVVVIILLVVMKYLISKKCESFSVSAQKNDLLDTLSTNYTNITANTEEIKENSDYVKNSESMTDMLKALENLELEFSVYLTKVSFLFQLFSL